MSKPDETQNNNLEISSSSQQQPQLAVDMPTGGDESTSPNEETPITTPDQSPGYGIFKRHMRYDPLMIIFTILVFGGGVIGYLTKQSTPSLVAGTIYGVLLAGATFFEGTRKNPCPIIVVLFSLCSVMTYRYTISNNFMPSGLVALLAFLLMARHFYLLYLRRQTL